MTWGRLTKEYFQKFSPYMELFGTIALALGAFFVDFNPESPVFAKWPGFLLELMEKVVPYHLWLLVVGLALTALGAISARLRSRKERELLQLILDTAQELAYKESQANGDAKHRHRITLFRYQKWRFTKHWSAKWAWWPGGAHKPWAGWLKPVLRSNEDHPGNTIYLANIKTKQSEGICGKSFIDKVTRTALDLPKVQKSNRHYRGKYATLSNMYRRHLDDFINGNKTLPRSLGAIPVRVGSKHWGVLVFDSIYPKGVRETISEDFVLTVNAIIKILE